MVPEFHPVASDVEVCETTSVFVQVTVVPTATVNSAGLWALRPSASAPRGIVTAADGPLGAGETGDGVGDGAGVGDE